MAAKEETGNGLIGSVDCFFSLGGEKEPGGGEDSFVYALNECRALLGVFDGCGGPGVGRYAGAGNRGGAYLASRAAAGAFLDWFDGLDPRKEPDVRDVKWLVKRYLKTCHANAGEAAGGTAAGRISKRMPTTAAAALCRPARSGVDVQLYWAGDSRVYLLDGEGLAQLTEDDLRAADPTRSLSEDAALTNVINLTRDFSIHSARLTMGRPGLLFAATDGCFRGLSTPMEFEYLLLRTLQSASSMENWEKTLGQAIEKTAGDDFTLCGFSWNFGSLDNMKRQLAGRTNLVYRNYIHGLESCSEEEKLQLWEHYKDRYYRLLCRP